MPSRRKHNGAVFLSSHLRSSFRWASRGRSQTEAVAGEQHGFTSNMAKAPLASVYVPPINGSFPHGQPLSAREVTHATRRRSHRPPPIGCRKIGDRPTTEPTGNGLINVSVDVLRPFFQQMWQSAASHSPPTPTESLHSLIRARLQRSIELNAF